MITAIGCVSKQRLLVHDLLLHPTFTLPDEQALMPETSCFVLMILRKWWCTLHVQITYCPLQKLRRNNTTVLLLYIALITEQGKQHHLKTTALCTSKTVFTSSFILDISCS